MKRIAKILLAVALVVCCLVGMMVCAQAATEKGIVTTPKTGVAYKLGIDQTNKGAIYYFTGEMSGYYGASEESIDTAADVYLETAPGGYYLTFKDAAGAKKYITMVQSGTHYNFTIADSASTVYTYDEQYNTFVTELDGGSFYMGTYNNFVTFGFSKYSYISTSFPAHLYTADGSSSGGSTTPTTPPATTPAVDANVVTSPKAGTAYKFGLNNGSANHFFTGEMSGYYGATTTNAASAVDVYLESVSGGYYLYFMDGNTKTYIYIYEYTKEGEKYPRGSFGISTDKPSTYFTYNSTVKTLVASFGENSYFMGTYGSYTTISASSTYYIEGDNAANVDKTQYPARLYAVEKEEEAKPASITTQPSSKMVKVGATAKFTVKATGTGLKYQWQYRTSTTGAWKNVSAASGKTAAYSLKTAARHHRYQYRCQITDASGNKLTTQIATLHVLNITKQPTTKAVVAGKTVTLTVAAEGHKVTYQWQYRTSTTGTWKNVSAASGKTESYSLKTAIRHHGYQYRCKITDSKNNVIYTNNVRLYVLGVKTEPTSKTVKVGAVAKFTVEAVGKGVTYQWQYRTSSSGSWKNVSAASGKTAKYSLTTQSRHNGYQYRCKLTDAYGRVTYTDIATLTVKK